MDDGEDEPPETTPGEGTTTPDDGDPPPEGSRNDSTPPPEGSGDDPTPPPPDRFAHEATDLAEFWTEYPLDFTPESLRHLDSLVAEHWPAGPDDDADPDVRRGMVIQFGSYFGETLVRNRGGEWTELGPGTWAVVVRGDEGEATVDPFGVARDCLDGSGRFRSLYESVAEGI